MLGILFSTSALAVENTAEVWNTNKVSAPLHGKHLSFAAEQEIRVRNSYGIYYSHSDFGVYNNSLDNISFSLNFREVFETRDGWWLLRASNTQPVLVARCESDTERGLQRLKDALAAQLRASGVAPPDFG
mgnify:CR=1 FL=1